MCSKGVKSEPTRPPRVWLRTTEARFAAVRVCSSYTRARTSLVTVAMSVIAGSVSLRAPVSARGLGFKTSQPTGTRVAAVTPARPFTKSGRTGLRVNAGNTNEGGLFAPIVIVARNVIGVKRFNQIRGKAIALHSQVRQVKRHRREGHTHTRPVCLSSGTVTHRRKRNSFR